MEDPESVELKREIENLRRKMEKKQLLLKKMNEQKELIARENKYAKIESPKHAKKHKAPDQSTSETGDSSSDTPNSEKKLSKKLKKYSDKIDKNDTPDKIMNHESDVSHFVSEELSESIVNLDVVDENEVDENAWKRISVLPGDKSNPIIYIHSFSADEDQPNATVALATVTNKHLTFWFIQCPEGRWENRRVEIQLEQDMEDRIVPLQSSTCYGIAFLFPEGQHSVWTCVATRDSCKLQKACVLSANVNFPGESNLYVIDDETLLMAIRSETKTVPMKIQLAKDFSSAESTLKLTTVKQKLYSFFPIIEKPHYVGGFSPSHLFIWNHNTGEVLHYISLNEDIGDRVLLATEEEGFIFLLMANSSQVAHVASIVAVKPWRQEYQIFHSMQLSAITDTDTDNPSWIKKMSQQKHFLSVLTNSGSIYMWDVLTSKVVIKVKPVKGTRCTFHLNESFNMLVIGCTNGNVHVYL